MLLGAGDIEAFITRDPLDFYENEVNEFPTVLTELTLEYLTFFVLYALDPLSLITRNNLTLFLPVRDLNQDTCAEVSSICTLLLLLFEFANNVATQFNSI